jgi:hypothetical protein
VAVLFRATVVSMVPAAPLLPATEPASAEVAHLVRPEVVGVDEEAGTPDVVGVLDAVDLGDLVVVDVRTVVVGDDELDEHAASRDPPRATQTTTAAIVLRADLVIGLVRRPVSPSLGVALRRRNPRA